MTYQESLKKVREEFQPEQEEPVEEEQDWLFTWGYSQLFPNRFVRIKGTYESSRETMFKTFGNKWCFQYPGKDDLRLFRNAIEEIDFDFAKEEYERLKEVFK
jgi:hypothetical protein